MSINSEPLVHDETINPEARQVLRSPEQVALHLPIAGPTSRMLAYAVDYAVILVILAGMFIVLGMTTSLMQWLKSWLAQWFGQVAKGQVDHAHDSGVFFFVFGVFLVLQLLLEWGYFVICEMSSGGRSFGKALVGLRVVCDGGVPISLRASLLRNLLRMVDALPYEYAIGLVSMLVSPDGKRLGDLAAGTIVVRLDRPQPAPPLPDGAADEIGVFRFDRMQIARLGTNERALLRQTLRRLETLPANKAETILAQAVEVLRARIGYEPITAEQRAAFLRALLRAARNR